MSIKEAKTNVFGACRNVFDTPKDIKKILSPTLLHVAFPQNQPNDIFHIRRNIFDLTFKQKQNE